MFLPKLGQSMEAATIVRWHVDEGGHVEEGEVIVTVETDKATFELESPATGALHILVAQGEEAAVETAIAAIGDAAAAVSAPRKPAPATTTAEVSPGSAPVPAGSRPLASPKARRLAAERGIDLATVRASSEDGVVSVEDVERAGTGLRTVRERRKLSGIRRTMARRTQEAWQTIPHIVQMVDVDATGLLAERDRLKARNVEATLNDILLHLVAGVMTAHPELNAFIDGDSLVLRDRVDVGFAVSTPAGLLVPVIRGASSLAIDRMAEETRRLVQAAEGGGLKPDEMGQASLTVSNLGMYGIRTGTPVINLGEAVLVFVGSVEERAVVRNGSVVARPTLGLSVAYDHRVADGVQAAGFTRDLKEAIEALAPREADVSEPSIAPPLRPREVTSSAPGTGYHTRVQAAGGHVFDLDEPPADGGADFGPTPVDAFLAGLVSCLTISFKAAGRRRKVPLGRVDARAAANERGQIKEIFVTLEVWSEATEAEVRALLVPAERGCYVRTLLKPEVAYHLTLEYHPL